LLIQRVSDQSFGAPVLDDSKVALYNARTYGTSHKHTKLIHGTQPFDEGNVDRFARTRQA
jgi:hypothetical protein